MSTESTQKASQGARELTAKIQDLLVRHDPAESGPLAALIDRELGELLEAAKNAADDNREDYSLGRFELRQALKKWDPK